MAIKHQAQLNSLNNEKAMLRLRDKISDGLIVEHTIKAGRGEIGSLVSPHNSADQQSEVHWAPS
ncbi:MAG: hypothetical protein CMM01_06675 [Rhodopirellula sp.]|nr:hypothetical protein [Rhodopirellula sp.]OUX51842.1 MAG: hypothetical protein CBE43_02040 [Rhodopirellula sp. TMED283]